MKKSVRGPKKTSQKVKFNIKKTILFKILIVCVVLLVILLFIWVGLKISERSEKKELIGELGTLCIFCSENNVILEILNYTILSPLSMVVNINWSEGNIRADDFNTIFIEFNKVDGNCNYTVPTDYPGGFPNFGENKSYQVNYSVTNCNQSSNFLDITSVGAYAEVDIHLTQIALIPNTTFYKDSPRQNLINLNQYFFSLVDINYSIVESPNNDNIEILLDNTTKSISISVLDGSWYGAQKFNLTAVSKDGEVLDTVNSGKNMSFFIIVINANMPVPNSPPSFNATYCDDLEWEVNTDYILNMKKCWYDSDGDDLTDFGYKNSSNYNKNLTIYISSTNLTLVPDTNWIGAGYFYLFVSDSKNESQQGRVDFKVVNSTIVNITNTTTIPADPNIKSSDPSGAEVYIFPGNKTFSITAENYEIIQWYLNGILIDEAGLSHEFSSLNDGDVIKVDVINGTKVNSKTWEIKIQGDEYVEESFFDVGVVIFYLIIAVIGVIIILVIWLIIIEKNKGKSVNAGFGVSGLNIESKGRGGDSDYLNIPG